MAGCMEEGPEVGFSQSVLVSPLHPCPSQVAGPAVSVLVHALAKSPWSVTHGRGKWHCLFSCSLAFDGKNVKTLVIITAIIGYVLSVLQMLLKTSDCELGVSIFFLFFLLWRTLKF